MTTIIGLTQQEADEYLRRDGLNEITRSRESHWYRILARQFLSPAILVLLATAIIYGLLGNAHDAIILLAIIIPSCLLTFVQEFRASGTLKRLEERLAVRVTVVRDGIVRQISMETLVRGDVVQLKPGDVIPADLILIDDSNITVDQSTLTGEAFPRRKSTITDPELFMGTHVVSGSSVARVVRTGAKTKFGELAERIAKEDVQTSFEKGVRDFGILVARAILILVAFVFTGNLVLQRPVFESLLFSLALAVGLTPQMLPVIISVCLSTGARYLASRKVLIKRLDAIEDLGTMEILCTDKTGTLTTGELSVYRCFDTEGRESESVARLAKENALLQTSSMNSIDQAIQRIPLSVEPRAKIGEADFTFDRRRVSVVTSDRDVITKGAFAEVLALATQARRENSVTPIGTQRSNLMRFHKEWSDAGFKVIAIATKQGATFPGDAIESEMTFEGFVLIADPPKADARDSLQRLVAQGIEVFLVTGDSALSATHVGREVGIPSDIVMRGEDIQVLEDHELVDAMKRGRIFAEIDPLQKLRILQLLRAQGRVVGFLGDGINDAAALKASDVAISVEDAVDVAKSASSVILLEKDLGVISDGVTIGRRTFENTMKYVRITISASFGNVVSMAIASFFLPFLPMLPTQILILNFLSDFPALAISTDSVDEEDLGSSRHWTMRGIGHFMVLFGLISTAFDLLLFFGALAILDATPGELRSSWFAASLITEVIAIIVLRTRRSPWRSSPSAGLFLLSLVIICLAFAVPGLGIFTIFDLPRVGWTFLTLLSVLVVSYGIATEVAKRWSITRVALS